MALNTLTISQLSSGPIAGINGTSREQELALAQRLYDDHCDTDVLNPGLMKQWGDFTVDAMICALGMAPKSTRYKYACRGLITQSPYELVEIKRVKVSGGMGTRDTAALIDVRTFIDETIIPEIGEALTFGEPVYSFPDLVTRLTQVGIEKVRMNFEGRDREIAFTVYPNESIYITYTSKNLVVSQQCTADNIGHVLSNTIAFSH